MSLLDDPMGMTRAFRVDVFANYAAVLIAGAAGLVLLPIYARLLGDRGWGMVSLCLLIQAIVMVFDMGMSQTLPRDVAKTMGDVDRRQKTIGLHIRAYLLVSGFVSLAGLLVTPYLVSTWFRDVGRDDVMVQASRLAVLWGGLQLLNGACIGFWSGSQQQALAVRRTTLFLLLRHFLTFCLLTSLGPSLMTFLWSCLLVTLLEVICNLRQVFRKEGSIGWRRTSFADCKDLFIRNRSVAISLLIGTLVTQMDRIVLSRAMPAADFGLYVVVLALGLAFLQLQYPLMTALYPRVALDRRMRLLPSNLGRMVVCVVLPCLLAGCLADVLLSLFLHRPDPGMGAMVTFRWLLAAVSLNALYHVFYQYMVVGGAGRWLAVSNAVVLVWVFLVTFRQVEAWGMIAGGVAWAGGAGLQLGSGLIWWFFNRRSS